MKDVTEVVAALIQEEKDGQIRFMVCQRPAHKARGSLWEFVGGKVEPGETFDEALIRECREELDVGISVGKPFMDVLYEYPDLTVHLNVFHARITSGTPKLLEHSAIAWILPREFPQYDFCPADERILKRIVFEDAQKTILPGEYRHFKGARYEVLGIAQHTETLEPVVVYRALYGEGLLWTRPVTMWLETVERNGKTVPRFEKI